MSQEPHLSASQIRTYELCPRKWAWEKIDGIKAPPHPSAALGSEVHKQIERYLKDGIPFDLTTKAGQIALAGAHLLPVHGTPGMAIEEPFEWFFAGHRIIGAKDVRLAGGAVPEVKDHKTTSSFTWALTPEKFADDIQAAIYAAHEMEIADTDVCDLSWHYLTTRKPYKAHPVRVRLTKEQIEPTLGRVRRLADEMSLIRRSGLRALDLPPNATSCEAFGGCFYRDRCNLSPIQRMQSLMAQDHASFIAEVQGNVMRQGGAGTAINPPPPPGAHAPVHSPPERLRPDGNIDRWNGSGYDVISPCRGFLFTNNNWVAIPKAAPPAALPPPAQAAPPAALPPPAQAAPETPLPATQEAPPAEPAKKRGRPRKAAANGTATEHATEPSEGDLLEAMADAFEIVADGLTKAAARLRG